MYSRIEIPLKGYLRSRGGSYRMTEERTLEFSCPIKIKLSCPTTACLTRKPSRSESINSVRSYLWGFATLVLTTRREAESHHAVRFLFLPRFDLILHRAAHKIGHGDYAPFWMGLDQVLDPPPEGLVKLHRDPIIFGGHYLLSVIILWASYPFRFPESPQNQRSQ